MNPDLLSSLMLILCITLNMNIEAQVNYEEEMVPDFNLPELLLSNDGHRISTSQEWINTRREEILDLFTEHMFGKFDDSELIVDFRIIGENRNALGGLAIKKDVVISFSKDGKTVEAIMLIYLPSHIDNPIPLFVGLNFYGNHTIHPDPEIPITRSYVMNNEDLNIRDNKADENSRGVRAHRWPVEEIIKSGFGLATIYYGDLDPDFDDDFQNGLHALTLGNSGKKAKLKSSISAWAYGLSKALDYFEQDEEIDHTKIAVFGHSRLGKSSLWAGAIDQRFAMIVSNNSGCGGAALSRRKYGETLSAINSRFPHCFVKDFMIIIIVNMIFLLINIC